MSSSSKECSHEPTPIYSEHLRQKFISAGSIPCINCGEPINLQSDLIYSSPLTNAFKNDICLSSPVVEQIKKSAFEHSYIPFGNRKALYIDDIPPRNWNPSQTIIEDVPVTSIWGMQNTIDQSRDCTFAEILFCKIAGAGRGRNLPIPWDSRIFDYYESSQNDSVYKENGGYLENFGFPGASRQMTMIRYGDRYYVSNGKHRLVPGMFYLYCKFGDKAYFKDVIVTNMVQSN